MEETKKKCNCFCEFFECGQRKLVRKQGSSSPSGVLCGWVGDPCSGSGCAYSACVKGRLREGGICGLLEKNIPVATSFSPRVAGSEDMNIDISTIAKPRVLKKIKWYETE